MDTGKKNWKTVLIFFNSVQLLMSVSTSVGHTTVCTFYYCITVSVLFIFDRSLEEIKYYLFFSLLNTAEWSVESDWK